MSKYSSQRGGRDQGLSSWLGYLEEALEVLQECLTPHAPIGAKWSVLVESIAEMVAQMVFGLPVAPPLRDLLNRAHPRIVQPLHLSRVCTPRESMAENKTDKGDKLFPRLPVRAFPHTLSQGWLAFDEIIHDAGTCAHMGNTLSVCMGQCAWEELQSSTCTLPMRMPCSLRL